MIGLMMPGSQLNELMQLHKAKPGEEDRWRTFSYGKCVSTMPHYFPVVTNHVSRSHPGAKKLSAAHQIIC